MKTTRQDFERFKAEFRRCQEMFGLTDWRVCFEHGKSDDDTYATINTDSEGRIATVIFASELDDISGARLDYDPVKTGRHEALELLIAELAGLAQYRYANRGDINAAAHGIIRRLEHYMDGVGAKK